MTVDIDALTERVNKIAEKYLTRNPDGGFREEEGYLRRDLIFPRRGEKIITYSLAAEVPPDYTSTTIVSLWIHRQEEVYTYFVSDLEIGDRIDQALEIFDEELKVLKERIGR